MDEKKIIIIGSGPAGYTAALYAARAGLKPLLFAGPQPGGLLTTTTTVENFPGFPEGINGVALVMNMQKQAVRFGTELLYDSVAELELTDGAIQTVITANGERFSADALIFAAGAAPRWLDLPSAAKFKGRGLSVCATCDGAFFKGVPVSVVGGGDSAMEEALTLSKTASDVYVLCRKEALKASKIMISRAEETPNIHIYYSTEVLEFLGEKNLEMLRLINRRENRETLLPCRGCFMALGHDPNTGLVEKWLKRDEKGYILAVQSPVHTSLAGVFAAGDCVDARYHQAITAAALGCQAAMEAERYLAGKQ
ncbi:MAG: thioredoxin-disulfide reductase [Lentisphaeria bacterium]|nr:thioredoxin-disulfide reductase [Lentisphaeria bacterium]